MGNPTERDALLGGSGASTESVSFRRFLETFWFIGAYAFGGPAAHVALLHDKYVAGPPPPGEPRVPEATFIELFALASALPGPGSTQLATALGATFGGLTGAIATFSVWQLPGSLMMCIAGLLFHYRTGGAVLDASEGKGVGILANYFIGLISAAFAMVCIAAVKIVSKACVTNKVKMAVCIITAFIAVLVPPKMASWLFVVLLILGGFAVLIDHNLNSGNEEGSSATSAADELVDWHSYISRKNGAILLCLFTVLTTTILLWKPTSLDGEILRAFWQIGATVFGGGQVVIPMILVLCESFLPVQTFLFGFGLVSLAPGPMFNISWFLGAALLGFKGGILAAIGLFAPGIILLLGLLPFWEQVRKWSSFRVFLSGVNASATGLIVSGVWMLLRRTLLGPLAFGLSVSAAALSLNFGVATHFVIIGCGLLAVPFVALGIGGPYAS